MKIGSRIEISEEGDARDLLDLLTAQVEAILKLSDMRGLGVQLEDLKYSVTYGPMMDEVSIEIFAEMLSKI